MIARIDTKAEYAPGVVRGTASPWYDDYQGTAEALVAAGIIQPGQIPGAPGMRKSMVRIHPGGEVACGPGHSAANRMANGPGSKIVKRAARGTYRVWVRVPQDVSDARRGLCNAQDTQRREAEAIARRAEIRLVWSRPLPTFTLHPPEGL